ncbi:hypothetical protein OIU84_020952 [Salix udensis]|uniref:Apyrase n=1 Tax=Salix udensis TaxID=889485 RepID=A0AAD6KTH1_9ROSI|nr:hypothetical protein OIU84_020952 [Salix udensis]
MRRPHARNLVESNTTSQQKMDPSIKLHSRTISPRSTKFKHTKPKLAIITTLIALLSCYYLFKSKTKSFSKRYSIIIDGGSTGTRIHVFGYRIESGGKVVFDLEEGVMKVSPGLSAYAEDPEDAGGSVEELVEFGKGRVPRELWGETEVRLMATAGMRLLDSEVQDRILDVCRRVLMKSGFKFQDSWASVITGSDEGLYAWVIANHALGALGGDPLKTTGIIELGGASAQVTFVSTDPVPPEFSRTVEFGNITYNIYSHSFLNFGQNAAFEALRESLVSGNHHPAAESLGKGISVDPCTPKGYSHVVSTLHSKGNFSKCRSAALTLLQKGKEICSYQHCQIGSIFIPKLRGKFLAMENFFYTSKVLQLPTPSFVCFTLVFFFMVCILCWRNTSEGLPMMF